MRVLNNMRGNDIHDTVWELVIAWRRKYYPTTPVSSNDPLQTRVVLQAAKAIPVLAAATRLLLGHENLAAVLHPRELEILRRTARIADTTIEIARRNRRWGTLTVTGRLALQHPMYPYSRFVA